MKTLKIFLHGVEIKKAVEYISKGSMWLMEAGIAMQMVTKEFA